jgi:hypothetical protein
MAKLKRIVLEFDDGTTFDVPEFYKAVYKSAERAMKAGEKEPWGPPPEQYRGKDDAQGGSNCFIINNTIVCP